MKNRKNKALFLGIAAGAALIAGAALCSVNGISGYRNANGAGNVQAYAAESESGASENKSANAAFRMLGASVRLAEDEKNGIRFAVGATKELYESTLKNAVESGILVLPDDLLGESELNVETAESLGAQKANISDLWRQDKDNANEYIAAAYLYDIPVSSYTRNICARAYYKTSDGKYVYADPVARSFNYVAQAALNDSEAEWSAEERSLLNGYLVKGYDGEILSFSNEKQASKSWGDPTVSFVSEYKGGNGLMKAELPQQDGFGFGHITAWQAAFWNNYYSDYNKIAFEFYVENAASLKYCLYVAQNALGSDGLTKNRDISLSGGGFIEGWNRVLADTSAFTAYYTKYCSDPMFWTGTSGAGVTVYFDEIYATHALTVTPAKTVGFTGVEIVLSDDSAEIFAGCTELTAEVRGADGVVAVKNGRFTPAKEGKYTVIYRAKDANGRNATASYVISVVAPEKAGLLYGFDSVAELGNYNQNILTWAEEYCGETGVVKFVNPKAADPKDPWQTAYMCREINVLFDKDYYTSHGKLIVRMYSDFSDLDKCVQLYSETPWKVLAEMQIKTAGWKDYVIDMSQFTDSWDAFIGTFMTNTYAAQYAFAEIRVADVVTVTNNGATTREPGEITLTDNAASVFKDCTAVKCEVLAPNGKIVPERQITAKEQGTYTVVYTGVTAEGKEQYASYTFGVYPAGLLWDFSKGTIGTTIGGNYQKENEILTFLTSYEGEKNVVKYHGTRVKEYETFMWNFSTVYESAHYDDFTKLTMRIYTPEEYVGCKLKFIPEGGSEFSLTLDTAGWKDYTVDVPTGDNWTKFRTQLYIYADTAEPFDCYFAWFRASN